TLVRAFSNFWIAGDIIISLGSLKGPTPWLISTFVSNLGLLAISYFLHLNNRRLIAEAEQQRQEKLRVEAELQLLRGHINPHFLFNVLNNIYSLAATGSSRTATTILQLSSLLRYVTYQGNRPLVALADEVEQVQQYITLFQLRSPTPLAIEFKMSDDCNGRQIEPMLMIPLVENAFKHGDFIVNANAYAHFYLELGERLIRFTGENSFDPSEQEKDEQGGIGLDNIRRRIELAYGPTAQLYTNAEPDKGRFHFSLHLPLAEKEEI
ncbi:MAG: histidine kinase, partial [Bacteroidota bacterium]